jgi:hypothetical protein
MPGPNENKKSMKGEPKHEDKGQAGKGSIKSEEHVGSSDGNGIRFPVHNYDGMAIPKTPGK